MGDYFNTSNCVHIGDDGRYTIDCQPENYLNQYAEWVASTERFNEENVDLKENTITGEQNGYVDQKNTDETCA